jgi:hypothetical protein
MRFAASVHPYDYFSIIYCWTGTTEEKEFKEFKKFEEYKELPQILSAFDGEWAQGRLRLRRIVLLAAPP